MCLTIDELRGLCTPDNIYLTLHASKRLEQRGILIDDVISCIMTGEIIEEYPNDYPYPSCLTLGNLNTKCPLHVVSVPITNSSGLSPHTTRLQTNGSPI